MYPLSSSIVEEKFRFMSVRLHTGHVVLPLGSTLTPSATDSGTDAVAHVLCLISDLTIVGIFILVYHAVCSWQLQSAAPDTVSMSQRNRSPIASDPLTDVVAT